jgi:hypothetical protein
MSKPDATIDTDDSSDVMSLTPVGSCTVGVCCAAALSELPPAPAAPSCLTGAARVENMQGGRGCYYEGGRGGRGREEEGARRTAPRPRFRA